MLDLASAENSHEALQAQYIVETTLFFFDNKDLVFQFYQLSSKLIIEIRCKYEQLYANNKIVGFLQSPHTLLLRKSFCASGSTCGGEPLPLAATSQLCHQKQ